MTKERKNMTMNYDDNVEDIILEFDNNFFTRAAAIKKVEDSNLFCYGGQPSEVDNAIKRLLKSGKIYKYSKTACGKNIYAIKNNTNKAVAKESMVNNNKIIYKLDSNVIEIPIKEGWELAEPEPRIPNPNKDNIICMVDGMSSEPPHHKIYDIYTVADHKKHGSVLANIPIFGKKRFIVKKVKKAKPFSAKIGDTILVSVDNERWQKRVFIKIVDNKAICLNLAESLEKFIDGSTFHWPYFKELDKK